jgi:hypothetical protein
MRRLVFGILGLLGVAFAAAPAGAISVPGCGDFIVFAKDDIVFESGLTLLLGDIFVQSPTGQVKVGAKNILRGTVSAHKIILGTDAFVGHCVADIIEGPGTCATSTIGFTPAAACTASFPPPPLTAPNVPACVATAPAVTVPAGASQTLASGCFGALRLNKDSTLTLTPGGIYNLKEVRQLSGSTLLTSAGAPASVNVKGEFITEPSVFLMNLLVNVQSSLTVHIGNGSLVTNVLFNVPNGNIHPHTGTQFRDDTELVARLFHDIQPITNEPPIMDVFCRCAPGFSFADPNPPFFRSERACAANPK